MSVIISQSNTIASSMVQNWSGEIAIQRQGTTRIDSTSTDTRIYAATAAGEVRFFVNGLNIGGFGTYAGASNIPVFFFDGPQSSTAGTVAFGVGTPTTGPGANFIISGQNAAGTNQAGGPLALQTGAPTGTGAIGPLSLSVSTAASTVSVTMTDTTVTVQHPTLQWDIATVAPTLAQVTGFGTSAVGAKLTVHAQDQIGTTSTGGALDVRPGSGTTAGGLARLVSGSAVARMSWNDTGIGFYTTAPIAKPTVTGAKGGNVALGSALTALANLGLLTDSSTA